MGLGAVMLPPGLVRPASEIDTEHIAERPTIGLAPTTGPHRGKKTRDEGIHAVHRIVVPDPNQLKVTFGETIMRCML
jgi:hypothetical protein